MKVCSRKSSMSKRALSWASADAARPAGLASAARAGWPVGRKLVFVDEVGGSEDEHLAHEIRVLLVSAHEPDHATPGRRFDDLVNRPRMTSWNSMRCWMTAVPRPPSSRVCSTLEKPPRKTHTTRSSA
jgi:hypothetical protein